MNKSIKSLIFLVFLAPVIVFASSSANYEIREDAIVLNSIESAGSASYRLDGSVGDNSLGEGVSDQNEFTLLAGYQEQIYDPFLAIETFIPNLATEVTISAVDNLSDDAREEITVSSTGDFSEGDLVLIVTDAEGSPVFHVMSVDNIVGNDIIVKTVVDNYEINDSVEEVSLVGVNRMYLLNSGSAIDFGSIDDSTVTERYIVQLISIDGDYLASMNIAQNQALTGDATLETIPAVADGEVTAGSSEYGYTSSSSLPSTAFDTEDTPISSNFSEIARIDGPAFRRMFVYTAKVSVSDTQEEDEYSHNVYLRYEEID